ncbi:hypothetical protein JL721_12598 [Aureococcus anophagefferens]|nr:hypothetical protein JL721_12598 [Aureococcus anophagefferens]
MGAIGIALNGIQLYGGAVDRTDDDDPGCELLDVSSDRGEWMGFDFCSGHRGANGFNPYHYHFPPSCLLDQAGKRARGEHHRSTTNVSHSPQIGWALDGFPVYGPRGPNGTKMKHAASGCVGSHCLDDCSGREEALGRRRSCIDTRDRSDVRFIQPAGLAEARESDYPFTFKCYAGCEWSDLVGEANRCSGGTPGVTDADAARATEGFTERYVSAEATAYWYAQNGDDAMAPLCASEPTAAPTSETWPPTTALELRTCKTQTRTKIPSAPAGGACYASEVLCVGDGGDYQENRCGDGGCCVNAPTAAPAPAPTAAPASRRTVARGPWRCGSQSDLQDDRPDDEPCVACTGLDF